MKHVSVVETLIKVGHCILNSGVRREGGMRLFFKKKVEREEDRVWAATELK